MIYSSVSVFCRDTIQFNMKKLILSTVGLFILNLGFSINVITIERSNGGQNGYSNITEKHEEGWIWDDHSLSCSDPGNSACDWVNPPTTPAGSSTVIEEEVHQAIENGQLSGSMVFGSVLVSWNGTSTTNYSITMKWG